MLSLWSCSAYLHVRVLIRHLQTACSLEVTHKHWLLPCPLIPRPSQPSTSVLYSVGNALGNTGSPKVSVRSVLTSVWGSNLVIISPEDKRERGRGREGELTARSFCLSWFWIVSWKDTKKFDKISPAHKGTVKQSIHEVFYAMCVFRRDVQRAMWLLS